MTDQDLKKLKRADLLELLIAEATENEALRARLAETEEKLRSREIAINEAGSLAEASLKLSGVIQAAQEAAGLYLENIEKLSRRQEAVCSRLEEESLRRAEAMIADAKARCQAMEAETNAKCEALLSSARRSSEAYWEDMGSILSRYGKKTSEKK